MASAPPTIVIRIPTHLGYLQAFFHFLTVGKSSLSLFIFSISVNDFE
jgi:hypothetical protein